MPVREVFDLDGMAPVFEHLVGSEQLFNIVLAEDGTLVLLKMDTVVLVL